MKEDETPSWYCSECGDSGWGAYSALFKREGRFLTWSSFGFQNDYDPQSLELAQYELIPTFSFDWKQYEAELRRYGGRIIIV